MNALEHDFSVTSLNVKHPFVAQHLLAKDLQNASQEVFQFFMIKGFITTKNEGLDTISMACMAMMVVGVIVPTMTVVMVIMAMVMPAIAVIMILSLQKMGVNIQFGVEIKAF